MKTYVQKFSCYLSKPVKTSKYATPLSQTDYNTDTVSNAAT